MDDLVLSSLPPEYSGLNPLPLRCQLYFGKHKRLLYQVDRVYVHSNRLGVNMFRIFNPVRIGPDWDDEFILNYHRDLETGAVDPFDPLDKMSLFSYDSREDISTSYLGLCNISLLSKSFDILSAYEHDLLFIVKRNRIVSSKELVGGFERPVIIANFLVLQVAKVSSRGPAKERTL